MKAINITHDDSEFTVNLDHIVLFETNAGIENPGRSIQLSNGTVLSGISDFNFTRLLTAALEDPRTHGFLP
jgi:hypothetical protein